MKLVSIGVARKPGAGNDDADGQQQRDQPVAQRPAAGPARRPAAAGAPLASADSDRQLLGGALRRLEEPVGQHRDDGQRHEQRGQQRHGHGEAERAEQLADQPPTSAMGRNTATVVSVEAVTAPATSLTAVRMASRLRLRRTGQMSFDVLQHHDRVVDHPADRDGQAAQGEQVERVVADPQRDQRDDHADRDRDRGDQGGPDRQQEDQDHQDGEGQAQQALGGQAADRLLDLGRLVEDDLQLAPPSSARELGQLVVDLVGDLDRVRAGDRGDARCRGSACRWCGSAWSRRPGGLDRGDVLELRRRWGAPGLPAVGRRGGGRAEVEVADLVDGGEAAADRDRVGQAALGDHAAGACETPLAVSALVTDCAVRPLAASSAGFRVMVTCLARAPVSVASRTPSMLFEGRAAPWRARGGPAPGRRRRAAGGQRDDRDVVGGAGEHRRVDVRRAGGVDAAQRLLDVGRDLS